MKRSTEFVLFTLIYIVAIVMGFFSQIFVEGDLWLKLLIFDLVMTVVIHIFSLILKNASLYDPYWSVIPPVLILFVMIEYKSFGLTNILMLFSISVWAIRLTYNWAINWSSFETQDWRYDLIKDKTKKFYPLTSFLAIMLLPTLVVFAQIIVASKIVVENQGLNLMIIISSVVILLATLLQGVSDVQMRKFREDNKPGEIMNKGVWSVSRHPNYLAEILVWWGVYGIYLSVFKTLDLMIIAPLIMTALFLFISIPLMETRMLKRRPKYQEYIEETSMLLPLPKFRKEERKTI